MSDGAGAVLLMRRSVAVQKGLPILGVFRLVKTWYISRACMPRKSIFWNKLHGSGLHSDPNFSPKSIWPSIRPHDLHKYTQQ